MVNSIYDFRNGRGNPVRPLDIPPMSSSITVSWAPSHHQPPVVYLLQYRLKGARTWINVTYRPMPATTCIVTGLIAGTLYEFRHIASGSGTWSEISQPTSLRAGVPPSAPSHLTVSA